MLSQPGKMRSWEIYFIRNIDFLGFGFKIKYTKYIGFIEKLRNNMPEKKKKLSIIVFSGDFDKLTAVFTLATGAAAVDYEVNLFFTYWGFNAIKRKKGHAFTGKGLLAGIFNFLMGGFNNLPLSRMNFGGISPKLMTGMMKRRNVATLSQLLEAAKELRVNFYACEMSMAILGIKLEELITPVREVIGVAKFLKLSEGGETLFI